MRAFITGATGFLGRAGARLLRARGDEVVALVRSPQRAGDLAEIGCESRAGDLSSTDLLRSAMAGCDSVLHLAAIYKVGIPKSEREAMYESNVRGTERTLDAAIDAGIGRIVYVSTVNAFGNTKGRVIDETYERPIDDRFVSYYDETKYLAHEAVAQRMRAGAPIVIAQPGGVYGPGDHSEVGNMIEQIRSGRMKLRIFPETGLNFVYIDDAARGVLLVHDRGKLGESYVLGGEIARMGDLYEKVAALSGRRRPRIPLPTPLIRLAIPAGPLVGKLMGFPPNLSELVSASAGVTYWATDAKARRELGYSPRSLDEGLAAFV
jgi:nucleoside-diphosphate-sugar epimerase